jgi:hypothetical protein
MHCPRPDYFASVEFLASLPNPNARTRRALKAAHKLAQRPYNYSAQYIAAAHNALGAAATLRLLLIGRDPDSAVYAKLRADAIRQLHLAASDYNSAVMLGHYLP